MLNLDLEFYNWSRIQYKQNYEPLAQTECVTVIHYKKRGDEITRLSDAVQDGNYMFGGKNAAGELQGKLRYLKPTTADGKIISVDFVKIRQTGTAPCGRTGHTIGYLP